MFGGEEIPCPPQASAKRGGGAVKGISEPDRLRENLEALKMKNTLEILDNYLERAVAENLNIVDVLDHIFAEEVKSKRKRAYEKQVQMSGFPIKKTLDDFDFSFQPSIDKRQIDELAAMRFLENAENVNGAPARAQRSGSRRERRNNETVRAMPERA